MSGTPLPPHAVLPARCAGVCYPSDPEACLDYFRKFFDHPGGAEWEADKESAQPIHRGIVAPHIDFRVSSKAYSHAFAPWLRRPAPDLYLILGVGHRARREWSLDRRDYVTPLGRVPVEAPLLAEIVRNCPLPLDDPSAHQGEHSIEFPLVLLQALRRLRGIERPFSFVPVLCGGMFRDVAAGQPPGPDSSLEQLAAALRPLLNRCGSSLQIIVSIDGCHIGPRFDHPYEVDKARLRDTAAWEKTLWQQVEERNLEGFFSHLEKDGNARYFDGVGALALALRLLGDDFHLRRTHYEQWFDPSDTSAVTFTSGILE